MEQWGRQRSKVDEKPLDLNYLSTVPSQQSQDYHLLRRLLSINQILPAPLSWRHWLGYDLTTKLAFRAMNQDMYKKQGFGVGHKTSKEVLPLICSRLEIGARVETANSVEISSSGEGGWGRCANTEGMVRTC